MLIIYVTLGRLKTAIKARLTVAYFNHLEVSESIFKHVSAKTLLIVGENDQNAPLDTVISAYKALPDADIAVIPNASHSVFANNFNAVWAVIEPFLQQ